MTEPESEIPSRSRRHRFRQYKVPDASKNLLSATQYTDRVKKPIDTTAESWTNPFFGSGHGVVTLIDDCLDSLWDYLESVALPELDRRSKEVLDSDDWVQQELGRLQKSFWLKKQPRDRSDLDKIIESEAVFEKLSRFLAGGGEEQGPEGPASSVNPTRLDISNSNIEIRLDGEHILDADKAHLSYSSDKKRRRWHKDADSTSRLLITLYGVKTPYVAPAIQVWIPKLPEDSDNTYHLRDTYESLVVSEEVFEKGNAIVSKTYFHNPENLTEETAQLPGQCQQVECIMNCVTSDDGVRQQLLHGFVTAEEIAGTPSVELAGKLYKRIFMIIDNVAEIKTNAQTKC